MRVNVVGKETVNYVKNGQPVQGIKLHVTYPFGEGKEGTEGIACDAPYFSNRFNAYHQAALVCVGDTVDMFYNQYGKIDSLQVVESASGASAVSGGKK